MPMIPAQIYQLVDWRLRQREGWLRRAEEAAREKEDRAADPHVPGTDEPIHRAGDPRHNKRLEAAVEADATLEVVKAWLRVFERVDKAFPPGSNTGQVAQLLYREGLSQAEVCRRLGRDRQYVRRQRDIYVCHCAVIAAASGLIRMKNQTGGNKK